MHRIHCAEVWGGIRDQDEDVRSSCLTASVFSSACAGGKGGDVYYVSVCGSDMITRLAVADVVGHGPAVSDVSEGLYAALQAHMNDLASNEVLAELNDLAAERGIRALTTAAVAAFYAGDSCLHFAYAGHAPALVHRRGEARWRPANLDPRRTTHPNAPLGVVPAAAYDQQHEPLESGDRIFLYTDGLVEAPSSGGEPFGEARLLAALARKAQAPLPELKSEVLGAVRSHTGGKLDHDDVTLLAVQVN